MIPEPALRAIAHPARRQILALVWDAERTSSELATRVGLSRPATSQHLKVLRDADLVAARRDGRQRLYSGRLETVGELRAFLDSFWSERLGELTKGIDE